MNQLFIKYQQAINKLPTEARAIILTIVLGFVFMGWYYGFWKGLRADVSKTNSSIKKLELTIPKLKTQLKIAEVTVKERREQASKNKTTESLKTKDTSPQLISPQKINEVLRDLLTARNRLVLLQLKNLPPKISTIAQTNSKIFEHGIIVKFQGDYFSTMHYLEPVPDTKNPINIDVFS